MSPGVRPERTCWICRASEATTGEHKWPAAYLRRIGDDWSDLHHGTWEGGKALHTQGPKSENLKLQVLCQQCNNSRTARQDKALDALLKAIESNEEEVWLTRS
jgi:5-methylcytosine-specific restriction endonuclease McrA